MSYKKYSCIFSAAAVMLMTAAVLFSSGCSKNDIADEKDQIDRQNNENQDAADNSQDETSGLPQGEITEIWFDEIFRAFYPKQLKNIFFTKTYLYGDVETSQPAICLCSEKITDISLFAIKDGKEGDVLYTVEALEPMESIMIDEQFSEEPHIGIRFKSADGTEYSYSISRNSDDTEIVLKEF